MRVIFHLRKYYHPACFRKKLKVNAYNTIISLVESYGCETWSLTLREEHRLRMLENKLLRKISGARRDKITWQWRTLHKAELHALHSTNIIRNLKSRRLRWTGQYSTYWAIQKCVSVLVGKPEGKRPFGRPRRRWEDNIKMDLWEVGCGSGDWIAPDEVWDQWWAYARSVMNLRVP